MIDDLSELDAEFDPEVHVVATIVFEGEKYASLADIVTWLMKSADQEEASVPDQARALRTVARTLGLKLLY